MTKINRKKKRSNAIKQQPKTRKELRKEKRLQKKENKKVFFNKKKQKLPQSGGGKFVRILNVSPKKEDSNEDDINGNCGVIDDERLNDQIESDFEFSDEEFNQKLNNILKTNKQKKNTNHPVKELKDRFHVNQEREKRKQNELEKKMSKSRIKQLKAANEEEDKIIKQLEKKLKIDKHKNNQSVHKMFSSDGLDYALELCLPENIEKMYVAAKEAAKFNNEDNEGNDFDEDLELILNRNVSIVNETSVDDDNKKKNKREKISSSEDKLTKKKQTKLKQIENKYFKNDSDDNVENENSMMSDESEEKNNEDNSINSESEDQEKTFIDLEYTVNKKQNKNSSKSKKKESKKLKTENIEKMPSDDDYEEFDEYEHELVDNEDNEEESNVEDKERNGEGIWEDIYGRKRDKHGNVIKKDSLNTIGSYVPPHARFTSANDDDDDKECDSKHKEKLLNLRRSCKGFMNRLSEANMHKIALEIENLYMKNSRHDMNNTLCKLLDEALICNVLSKERLVLEHAMLIAVLHANVGNEIGGHFLQFFIIKFDKMLKDIYQLEVEDKRLDNTVLILSHLYTFKIFQHNLIFEIINKLIENLCEKSVECLLLILRSVGFQLRKDDPIALKELIITIQKKAIEVPSDVQENSRLKFMLDILNAIKNNNINKIPNYDPTLSEHLKKYLKSILINGKYVTTLNITLNDLLNADEKGKWWVIGSAWTGNIQDIGSANQLRTATNKNQSQQMFSEKLLELAEKQRMNTEDRKNVFCILMSAEDYLDAFERLLHLSIKDHRIISSIIIHCCLSEKSFNPYYSVLAQKFCECDRKYQLAFQFASWDRIKDIHSLTKLQIQNLAKLLTYLILNGGLPISILKVVEFSELNKTTLRLVRQIILGILLAKEEECNQVFERIAPSMKLNTFKDSIRLFMHHFLLKESAKSSKLDDEKIEILKTRVMNIDQILETIGSKVKF